MLENFLSTTNAKQLLDQADTLAVLSFDGNCQSEALIPSSKVAQVSGPESLEVWKVIGATVERGVDNNCEWNRSDKLQFISISAPLTQADDIQKATFLLYQELLSFVENSPFTKLIRFWNYIPHINHGDGDKENYKRFCTGRLDAFEQHDLDDLQFPAASAVGHYTDGITVYALTTNTTPKYHANPRQLDAFKYPRQYGPSSPSFARASTVKIGDQQMCFISGTASILGHDSVHQGDLRLQLYTTNDNILYLLKETGFKRETIRTLRVYLRNTDDYLECKEVLEELFPNSTIIYTHADICRGDLLVEIECYCVAQ